MRNFTVLHAHKNNTNLKKYFARLGRKYHLYNRNSGGLYGIYGDVLKDEDYIINTHPIFMAFIGETPIGSVVLLDGTSKTSKKVIWIYVKKGYRNLGIGTALIKEVKKHYKRIQGHGAGSEEGTRFFKSHKLYPA